MKKSVKRKIKKQLIFNLLSIIFVVTTGIYFLSRLIYYKIESDKEFVYSDIFYKRIIEQNDNYYLQNQLVKTNSIYRFVGDTKNNFVKFKGFLWRIIRINKDNSITMITEDSVSSLAYGSSLKNDLLAWLNKTDQSNTGFFEVSLEDAKLMNNKLCTDSFKDIQVAGCFETNNEYKIGLLSIDDYLKAGANESYLTNGNYFWTSNSYDNNHAWYIADNGLVSSDDYNNKYGIRPVITINGDVDVYNGDGTADNPYIIEIKPITKLAESYVGQYVSFNNTLWKIVSKDTNKIKIVSEECLKKDDDTCLADAFSKYDNEFNAKKKDSLLYYLNNTYYKSIEHNDYIVSGPFYTGTYSLSLNNYRTATNSKTNLKVGMLSMVDLFAYEVPNTFLLTTSPDNDSSIFSVSDDHALYETMVTQELNIRPAIYLKDSLRIVSGDGSYLLPFVLGDE